MTGFDWQTALTAYELLDAAVDRLVAVEDSLVTASLRGPERRAALLSTVSPVAEALMWARTLDDVCQGKEPRGGEALPGYVADRSLAHPGSLDLDAARYAANKVIHMVAELNRPMAVMVTPVKLPGDPDQFGRLTWARGPAVPPPRTSGDVAQHRAYCDRFAGLKIVPILTNLRGHFSHWLLPR